MVLIEPGQPNGKNQIEAQDVSNIKAGPSSKPVRRNNQSTKKQNFTKKKRGFPSNMDEGEIQAVEIREDHVPNVEKEDGEDATGSL